MHDFENILKNTELDTLTGVLLWYVNYSSIKKNLDTFFSPKFLYAWPIVTMGFPGGLPIKKLPANAEDVGLIPGLVRSLGVGNGNPFFFPPVFLPGKSHRQRIVVGYSPVCVLSC